MVKLIMIILCVKKLKEEKKRLIYYNSKNINIYSTWDMYINKIKFGIEF